MSAEAIASHSLVEHQQTPLKWTKRAVVAGGATIAAAGVVLLTLGLIRQARTFNGQENTSEDNLKDITLQEEQRPLRNNPDNVNHNNPRALGMMVAGEVVILAGATSSAIILKNVEKRERGSALYASKEINSS